MTSSNGNIFRVTDPFWGEPPALPQRPVTQSFDAFFDLRLNKWLSRWFKTSHYDATVMNFVLLKLHPQGMNDLGMKILLFPIQASRCDWCAYLIIFKFC